MNDDDDGNTSSFFLWPSFNAMRETNDRTEWKTYNCEIKFVASQFTTVEKVENADGWREKGRPQRAFF